MIYTFVDESGKRAEIVMSVKEYSTRVRDGVLVRNGKRYTRDLMADLGGCAGPGGHSTAWPLKSESVGVLPHQVGEAKEYLRKRGVSTEFTADGRAIFRDRAHRKAHCKAWGVVDLAGGYGDA